MLNSRPSGLRFVLPVLVGTSQLLPGQFAIGDDLSRPNVERVMWTASPGYRKVRIGHEVMSTAGYRT